MLRNLRLIYAQDTHRGIGVGGKMPWNIPEDMAHFKAVTMGHTVIMGRKTWESIPGKYLPHRRNIIVTNSPQKYVYSDIEAVSIEEVDSLVHKLHITGQTAFVIGGQTLFEKFKDAEWIYRTRIFHTFECDTFAPELDESQYELVMEKPFKSVSGYSGSFEILRRKKQ